MPPDLAARHVPPRRVPAGPDAVGRPERDPYFRPGACKRRRDVLLCLVSGVLGTGVVGAIPQLRIVLAATAFFFVLVVLYLAMLVRMRRRAMERTVKLRYLPRPASEPAIVLRRSAAR